MRTHETTHLEWRCCSSVFRFTVLRKRLLRSPTARYFGHGTASQDLDKQEVKEHDSEEDSGETPAVCTSTVPISLSATGGKKGGEHCCHEIIQETFFQIKNLREQNILRVVLKMLTLLQANTNSGIENPDATSTFLRNPS